MIKRAKRAPNEYCAHSRDLIAKCSICLRSSDTDFAFSAKTTAGMPVGGKIRLASGSSIPILNGTGCRSENSRSAASFAMGTMFCDIPDYPITRFRYSLELHGRGV